MKNWDRRFFASYAGYLLYFMDSRRQNLLAALPLDIVDAISCKMMDDSTSGARPLPAIVLTVKGRDYLMRAPQNMTVADLCSSHLNGAEEETAGLSEDSDLLLCNKWVSTLNKLRVAKRSLDDSRAVLVSPTRLRSRSFKFDHTKSCDENVAATPQRGSQSNAAAASFMITPSPPALHQSIDDLTDDLLLTPPVDGRHDSNTIFEPSIVSSPIDSRWSVGSRPRTPSSLYSSSSCIDDSSPAPTFFSKGTSSFAWPKSSPKRRSSDIFERFTQRVNAFFGRLSCKKRSRKKNGGTRDAARNPLDGLELEDEEGPQSGRTTLRGGGETDCSFDATLLGIMDVFEVKMSKQLRVDRMKRDDIAIRKLM